MNRYVWNMRYDGATKLDFVKHRGHEHEKDGNNANGPQVLPGTYQVTVKAGGHSASETVTVKSDPNQQTDLAARKANLKLGLAVRNTLSALDVVLNRVTAMQATLKQFEHKAGDDKRYAATLKQAKALDKELGKLKDGIYNPKVQHEVPEDDLHFLSDLHGGARTLSYFGGLGDQMPTQPIIDLQQEVQAKVEGVVQRFNALQSGDVAAYNKAAYASGAPTLMVGDPVTIEPATP